MSSTVLGKRKLGEERPAVSTEEAQAIFRRHFEAQFAPIEGLATNNKCELDDEDDSNPKIEDLRSESGGEDGSTIGDDDADQEWDGFSEDDDDDCDRKSGEDEFDDDNDNDNDNGEEERRGNKHTSAAVIEVVDHTKASTATATPSSSVLSKSEAKAYLSSRVPSTSLRSQDPLAKQSQSSSSSKKGSAAAAEDSAEFLRNDLALQRLISESHLFKNPKSNDIVAAASSLSSSSVLSSDGGSNRLAHSGRQRHLATDLRLSALGSRSSIYRQDKMPMAHRKGMNEAAAAREAKRRAEAKENGIVLERPSAGKKGKGRNGPGTRKRERAVDAPSVGNLRGSMLKLSRRDIREIQGPEKRGFDGKRRKKRR